MAEKYDFKLNLDDKERKRELSRRFNALLSRISGRWQFHFKPCRLIHSQKQRGYYFAEVVQAFIDYVWEQNQQVIQKEDAHAFLKKRVLPTTPVVGKGGEILDEFPAHIRDTDTAEFYEFVEKARAWLLDELGVFTNDPEPDEVKRWKMKHEQKEEAVAA